MAKTQDRKEYKRRKYLEKHEEYKRRSRENYYSLSEQELEKKKEQRKRSFIKNKEHSLPRDRIKRIGRLYNLSSDAYFQMLTEQGNRCAICKQEEIVVKPSGDIKPLSVDHNHSTGLVRKLLCTKCNTMLGMAREDSSILKAAIEYLDFFEDSI